MPDIQMPDGQIVRFPDTMSPTSIRGLIAQRYPREVGEAGRAKPMAERETTGHYAFDETGIPKSRPYADSYFAQGTSGLNEGLANVLGAPVDLSNAAIGLGMRGINAVAGTNLQPSAEPLGGSAGLKKSLTDIGSIQPPTEDQGQQFMRRTAQSVGAAAVPGLGAMGAAEKPLQVLAGVLASGLGGGASAATANQLFPGNQTADMLADILGSLGVAGGAALAGRAPRGAPKIDDVRAAKDAAYKTVDDMGVTYTPQSMQDLRQGLSDSLTAAEIDSALNPRASRVAQLLDQRLSQGGRTLSQLDKDRQLIRNNVVDVPGQKIEGRFAGIMKDEIDDFINSATANQLATTGDPAAAAAAIANARKLNSKVGKYEDVSQALNVAEHKAAASGSGGNIDNASRQAIRAILDNPKQARKYSPIEQALMEKLVVGGKGQNLARQVGKLSPSGNGLQQALALGATAYNPVMGILPGTGLIAKAIADRATGKNAQQLIDAILSGGSGARPALMNDNVKRVLAAVAAGQTANALGR